MSVGHACLSLTFSSKLVFEPQLDQKKISTPSFLHFRAQSGSRGPFPLNLRAWLRSFTLVHTHSFAHIQKTAFSAPHSTSSPHLAQTEQVRLTRFFALPDSNTPPRVTNSVLGRVVVSQMGIVQVPYATVILKYFRALSYGFFFSLALMSAMAKI